LFNPIHLIGGCFLEDILKPGIGAPLPDNGTHYIGHYERIKQFGKNKDFHIGKREGRGVFFQILAIGKVRI
jgi:hypothetical protein